MFFAFWPNLESFQKLASETASYIANSANDLYEASPVKKEEIVEKAKNIKDSVIFHVSLGYNIVNHSEQTHRWWDRITDNLVLGALPFHERHHQSRLMDQEKVRGVIMMCRDFEFNPLIGKPVNKQDWESKGVKVYHSPTQDFEAPSVDELRNCVEFMTQVLNDDPTCSIYVHCKAGRGRSVAVIVCFLISTYGYTTEEAIDFIMKKRSHINMGKTQCQACKKYEKKISRQYAFYTPTESVKSCSIL